MTIPIDASTIVSTVLHENIVPDKRLEKVIIPE
jgi:hypothetical protein